MPGDDTTSKTTKRPFVEAFAEAISDGVWCQEWRSSPIQIPMVLIVPMPSMFRPAPMGPIPPNLFGPKVPAKQCKRLHSAARHDMGETGQHTSDENNVSRNAYRWIRRAGVAWKVPLDVYHYECDDGLVLDIHYIHPKNILKYLIEHHPVVIFGTGDKHKAKQSLRAFWQGYSQYHSTHEVFSLQEPFDQLIPIALHGGEGRGKRRSQTTVFSLESVLGITGHSSVCTGCCPNQSWDAPYGEDDGYQHPFLPLLRHNMKGHSFLQHFPLFILPGTLWKNYKSLTKTLVTFLAGELKTLFHDGLQAAGATYRIVVVGSKGDLKWVGKIANLTRGYENQGRVQDLLSCHQCMAGSEQLPAEDFSTSPCWEPTVHSERPWSDSNLPCLMAIPFDQEKPELLYRNDVFHTLRLGIYRDFSASCIFLFMKWGYFGCGNMPEKLEAAHGHFTLYLRTVGKTAALRSFTLALFNYQNAGSYVWSNTKGSDTMLLCEWLVVAARAFLVEETDRIKRQALSVVCDAGQLSLEWFDLIYKHGMFLPRCCAATLYEKGQAFLNGYAWLANFAMGCSMCLFGVKPKCHFQKHTLLEIYWQLQQGCLYVMSPVVWDCSQNEDLMGRVCKLGRKVDTRVITQRVLEFYLIKAAVLLRRHERVHKDLDCKFR